MKKIIYQLLVVLIIVLSINSSLSEETTISKITAYNNAVKHIAVHTGLSEEQVLEFNWDACYLDSETDEWQITLFYTSLSHNRIRVDLMHGICVYCECEWYSLEDYNSDVLYKEEIWPTVEAAMSWEKSLGPHELWNVRTNADFYNQYGHIPYMSEYCFYRNINPHYDFPIHEMITEEQAIELANKAIRQKYPNASILPNELLIGSFFCDYTPEPSTYTICYYDLINEELELYYMVILQSDTGLCEYVEQHYGRR